MELADYEDVKTIHVGHLYPFSSCNVYVHQLRDHLIERERTSDGGRSLVQLFVARWHVYGVFIKGNSDKIGRPAGRKAGLVSLEGGRPRVKEGKGMPCSMEKLYV